MTEKNRTYTAIVYVHGIGRQTRYEGLTKLLDHLDHFAAPEFKHELGLLRDFQPHIIPGDSNKDVGYVSVAFKHFIYRHSRSRFSGNFRAYDLYWSNVTTAQSSVVDTLAWGPKTLFGAFKKAGGYWRSKPREKMTLLLKMAATGDVEEGLAVRVLHAFKKFQKISSRDKYPKGSFSNFISWIQDERGGDGREKSQCELARKWHWAYILLNVRNVFFYAYLFLCLLLGAWVLLKETNAGFPHTIWAFQELDTSVAIVAALLLAVTIPWLFNNVRGYVSDVILWSSYNENEKYNKTRKNILAEAKSLLERLILDENCKRIIIISHSLGSAVAYDALRSLNLTARLEGAKNANIIENSKKISDFVTLGSPIELLFNTFERRSGEFYRFERIQGILDGDLSYPPFYRPDGELRWQNFWDRSDPISGELWAPHGFLTEGQKFKTVKIKNFEVANSFLPSLGSHTTYFDNEDIIGQLFGTIFFDRPDEFGLYRPLLRTYRALRWLYIAAVVCTIPIALLYLIVMQSENRQWASLLEIILGVCVAFPMVTWLVTKIVPQNSVMSTLWRIGNLLKRKGD